MGIQVIAPGGYARAFTHAQSGDPVLLPEGHRSSTGPRPFIPGDRLRRANVRHKINDGRMSLNDVDITPALTFLPPSAVTGARRVGANARPTCTLSRQKRGTEHQSRRSGRSRARALPFNQMGPMSCCQPRARSLAYLGWRAAALSGMTAAPGRPGLHLLGWRCRSFSPSGSAI
jgi:hypothetical protein